MNTPGNGPQHRPGRDDGGEPDIASDDPLLDEVRLRERRRARWRREGDPSVGRWLAQIGVLGWIFVAPIMAGILIGRWLDHLMNSGVLWTGPLLMLGVALGFWSAWKWMKTS